MNVIFVHYVMAVLVVVSVKTLSLGHLAFD